jgi:hypothetical protein
MMNSEMALILHRTLQAFPFEKHCLPKGFLRKHHDPWRKDSGGPWVFYFDVLGKPTHLSLCLGDDLTDNEIQTALTAGIEAHLPVWKK